jgi:hypothetical protein
MSSIPIVAALTQEQGIKFAVVQVRQSIITNQTDSIRLIQDLSKSNVFGNVPIILKGDDNSGLPVYYGRTDIVNFLSNVPVESLPWADYKINL